MMRSARNTAAMLHKRGCSCCKAVDSVSGKRMRRRIRAAERQHVARMVARELSPKPDYGGPVWGFGPDCEADY